MRPVRRRGPTALCAATGAFLCLGLGGCEKPDPIQSPRLLRLRDTARHGDPHSLQGFWQEIDRDGAPLVEATAGSDECLLTFLWRSSADTRVVVLTDFGESVPEMTMERVAGTDVWFRSVRLRNDARFVYEFAVDDPAYPFVDGDSVRYPTAVQPDPRNRRQWDFAKPHIMSVIELPNAPPLTLSTPDPSVPHGVVGRFAKPLASAILRNERDIFVYQPPGYSESGQPYPLLLFGASYINQIRLPVILDNLIAQERIPPVVAIFVGFPQSPSAQDEEAGGGDAYGNFIAGELLPWVRERVHVTSDPHRTVIGGASAGGHSAACVALQHPEAIGNVLAQSGAFWRGIGHTADYWSHPLHANGREGFVEIVVSRPAVPVRFYLTIGGLERGRAFDRDLVSMLDASRNVRDALQAKGYEVTLRESSGGHDPYNWETTLPEALTALLEAPMAIR